MKKKVFLYVGHEGWGKSETLRKITGNDKKKKIITISKRRFFVKKMSAETKLLKYAKSVEKSKFEYHVLAFCPNQLEKFDSLFILRTLEKCADLYFYVQKYSSDGSGNVTDNEINSLRKFGQVSVNHSLESSGIRAEKLILFIEDQFTCAEDSKAMAENRNNIQSNVVYKNSLKLANYN